MSTKYKTPASGLGLPMKPSQLKWDRKTKTPVVPNNPFHLITFDAVPAASISRRIKEGEEKSLTDKYLTLYEGVRFPTINCDGGTAFLTKMFSLQLQTKGETNPINVICNVLMESPVDTTAAYDAVLAAIYQ